MLRRIGLTGHAPAALALLCGIALMLRSAFPMEPGLDYFHDASGPIDALARGDLGDFAAQHALMGPFSLLLRAPFVALVFHGSLHVVYYAGVLPCLGALVWLVLILRRRMRALGRPAAAIAAVTAVALLNPGVFRSIHWGHPEELLAGALCVGAALAAGRDRTILAALLLGLAVATKQWALVAVVPVVLAAPRRRLALLVGSGAVAAALILPTMVAAPETFVSVQRSAAQAGGPIGPANVWWLVSSPRSAADRAVTDTGFAYEIPLWLSAQTHPLIVLFPTALGVLLWLRRKGRVTGDDALGLLALALLLRCVLDPWNNDYYHAPFLLALLAWESLARSGWPRLTVFAGAALSLTFPASAMTFTELSAAGALLGAGYLAWALPLTGWLALSLFAPARAEAVAAAVRSRMPAPARRAANVARA